MGGFGGALVGLWRSLGVALGWLWSGFGFPIGWLSVGFGVALGWLCTPESMPSIWPCGGLVMALWWLWMALAFKALDPQFSTIGPCKPFTFRLPGEELGFLAVYGGIGIATPETYARGV